MVATSPLIDPSVIPASRLREPKAAARSDARQRKLLAADPLLPQPVTCPFTIVIDSREQAPYSFAGLESESRKKSEAGRPLVVNTVTAALPSGDYSIVGMEHRIACERKSAQDWFGSIGGGRERFEREMERLSELEFAAVVIEADWNSLLFPEGTRVTGKACSRTIASWSARYRVHFFPLLSRRHAELFTFQLLSMFWRQQERRKEAVLKAALECV